MHTANRGLHIRASEKARQKLLIDRSLNRGQPALHRWYCALVTSSFVADLLALSARPAKMDDDFAAPDGTLPLFGTWWIRTLQCEELPNDSTKTPSKLQTASIESRASLREEARRDRLVCPLRQVPATNLSTQLESLDMNSQESKDVIDSTSGAGADDDQRRRNGLRRLKDQQPHHAVGFWHHRMAKVRRHVILLWLRTGKSHEY